jgi:hypothetical protein
VKNALRGLRSEGWVQELTARLRLARQPGLGHLAELAVAPLSPEMRIDEDAELQASSWRSLHAELTL